MLIARIRPLVFAGLTLALLLGSTAPTFAKDRQFNKPRAFHANTYPARDHHKDEQVSIAADPYDMTDKTRAVFSLDYKAEGILPVHLIISNDGEKPISLRNMNVMLVTKRRAKIAPADEDDIYRRISKQIKRGDEPVLIENPIPMPKKKKKAVSKAAEDEVTNSQFLARAVEAKSSRDGFFFFDIDGIDNALAGAYLVVTGIADGDGRDLFFFEIPMEKYLSYQPGKPAAPLKP